MRFVIVLHRRCRFCPSLLCHTKRRPHHVSSPCICSSGIMVHCRCLFCHLCRACAFACLASLRICRWVLGCLFPNVAHHILLLLLLSLLRSTVAIVRIGFWPLGILFDLVPFSVCGSIRAFGEFQQLGIPMGALGIGLG
jgi:hypothetical protein